jgi:hypothetical protein
LLAFSFPDVRFRAQRPISLLHDNDELQPEMLEERNCNKRMASAAEWQTFPLKHRPVSALFSDWSSH